MCKKLIMLLVFTVTIQITKAQNEFITIWRPGNPSTNVFSGTPSTASQIWFPGTGNNFTVSWEEIGFPAHTNIFTITSTDHFLIDFGAPANPNPGDATYKVKISNGNGNFHTVKFPNLAFISPSLKIPNLYSFNGDVKKILEVSQWGDIQWSSMEWAFSGCSNLNVTATDIPDLSSVTSMSAMFYNCTSLIGNPTINLWNTSSVTNMSHVFASSGNFNQPVGNWDVSNVTNMDWMFHYLSKFNQPIGNWNTSKVTSMMHMLHICSEFNQDITNWDTSNVTDTRSLLEDAVQFNYSLGKWNLGSVSMAGSMITNSGIDCSNYSNTLVGWAGNPATPSGLNLYSAAPLIYSSAASVIARNYLVTTKNWSVSGDNYSGECQSILGVSDVKPKNDLSIYPNPATDFIFARNSEAKKFTIIDQSGRMVSKGMLDDGKIDIRDLVPGNYILQLTSDKNIQNLKFIRK